MRETNVLHISSNVPQAEKIIQRLTYAGISSDQIMVRTGAAGLSGAGTGGVLGGTLGLLAGIGTLALPGLDPFVVIGPVVSSISCAVVGAVVGGLAGAFFDPGEGVFIAVDIQTEEQAQLVRSVFKNAQSEKERFEDRTVLSDRPPLTAI